MADYERCETGSDGVGDACCCRTRGDIDNSGGEGPINISDLTYFVSYLFQGGALPPCPEQRNVDGQSESGNPFSVADLTMLVAYLFSGGGSAAGLSVNRRSRPPTNVACRFPRPPIEEESSQSARHATGKFL